MSIATGTKFTPINASVVRDVVFSAKVDMLEAQLNASRTCIREDAATHAAATIILRKLDDLLGEIAAQKRYGRL